MNPWTDDAVPARWPNGSIAIELKFDPIQPNCSMAAANSGTKTKSGNCPNSETTNQIVVTAKKPTRAPCDSRRMPKRPTSLELTNDDTAIMPAIAAKSTGNHTPRP